MTTAPAIAFHIDDVGCAHGSNTAMEAAWDAGLVMSGSTIVPSGWFAETAGLCRRRPEIDMGVHLALTSESVNYRWRPLSTSSTDSGLVDDDGFMWSTVDGVRRHADPAAVDVELRRQIDTALDAGINVTHIDHHMGAAVLPELIDITVGVAIDYGLPMLLPAEHGTYLDDVGWNQHANRAAAARARLERSGLATADRFWMGLDHQDREVRATFEALVEAAPPGVTYASLHCAEPGDIEAVHPRDCRWRIAEHELLTDPSFVAWVRTRPVELVGIRQV